MALLKSVSIERESLNELTDKFGSIVVLHVSVESARLLPKRITGVKGSDIILEDVVMSKIISASQLVDESGESPTVHFLKIYMDKVGGLRRHNVGSSSASTSQPQDYRFDARVKEYVQEMKKEMKHEMREELREKMKNEMQLKMQEEVDKILQERLPILIAGLPKPPLIRKSY
ncbi:hypothetical protein H5410_054295 [Solanum commersonii]|uniref:Uncharacterized protein n=1 Tax=Solanum commersonii TaxID=4109 RepID=A0A9J5X8W0_SOLCO|nr:hypothetical protein H5410_054295 [Solanum commersonii]